MKELDDLQTDIAKWGGKTFGMHRLATPVVYHLKKEVDELISALKTHYAGIYAGNNCGKDAYIKDRERLRKEHTDCLILLLQSASLVQITGAELLDAARAKMEINKTREWGPPDENGVIEHIV